ncbi:MAG: clan AA aspartic protease [Deltaproteobacteria bacterium]|nr:clan AA aspartic protease [Deltaproteobacteria bacterium]
MANFPYRLNKRLVVIPVVLYGKKGRLESEFILDTGASLTIVDHSLALSLGYSARDGIGLSTVSSVIGKERGYRLMMKGFETLGRLYNSFEVACHDLQDQGIEGLVGMNFLEKFDWCVHPNKQVIFTKEKPH